MRIAHIADVHFRSLSRHAEYKEVFEAFAIDCETRGVDQIVVCGDIFHTKTTGLSPEYIDVLTWWMKRLSSVATLHLTLGNHDGNLTNRNRQDAVTPIYEAVKKNSDLKNNIFLYKNSGVYPIDNKHNLCVFSLFDEEGWDSVKPELGKYNIAIYHGSVDTALTETEWVLKSHIKVDTFKDYDLALLGDIHRTQFLGYREINGKNVPWIGYPGSTLQQNYAEAIDHGYLLWDITPEGHDVSFIKLPNPQPYVTINWSDDLSGVNLPTSSRIRVRHTRPLTQAEIKATMGSLQSRFKATEVIFNLDSKAQIRELVSKIPSIKENFHNAESLLSLLQRYDSTRKFSESDWESLKSTLVRYLLECKDDVSARNVKWSLRELKWDNILGYGSGNKINFTALEGIVGIFGPNRAGKSSIIGALLYCMFNTSDRGSIKNLDLINVRKDHSYARAVLDVNGETHVIERQSVKNTSKKDITASTSVNLYKIIDDSAIELNGEQRVDTDKIIRSIVGSSEDFMLMSLSTQGDIDRFVRDGSTHRKHTLARFLDLDFFDRLHEIAKSEVTSLKAEIKTLQSSKIIDPSLLATTRKESKDEISTLLNQRDELSENVQRLVSDVKMSGFQEIEAQFRKKENELNSLRKNFSDVESELKTYRDVLTKTESRYDECLSEFNSFDLQALKEKYTKIKELKQISLTAKHAVEKWELELHRKKKSISVLSEVPCGDSYPTCKFIKDAYLDRGALDETTQELSLATENLSNITLSLQELESSGLEALIRKADVLRTESRDLELSLHKLRLNVSDREEKFSITQANLTNCETELKKLDGRLKKSKSAIKNGTVDTLQELKSDLRLVEEKLSALHTKLGALDEQLRQSSEITDLVDSKMKALSVIEYVMTSFSKRGIPSKILSEQLPVINSEISNVLAGIVNFNVELECSDNNNLDVFINYGDSRRIMELCSGMEKMISSIAIRVALTNVSTMPKSDVFIIDEGFGTLDDANVDACKRLLMSLKKYFKSVLIISHVPAIKDVADIVLEVQRVENDSKMCYG